MRKFLILALAFVMVFSLFACKKDGDDTSDSTPTVTDPVDTEPTDNTTAPSDTDETNEPEDTDEPVDMEDTEDVGTTNAPDEDEEPDGTEFVSVNETVYVYGTSVLNVRKEPSKDSEKVGEMKEGEQVTRIGYNGNWSKISYYGTTCYASSDHLTTQAPLNFSDKTDTVYVIAESTLNLRKKPHLKGEISASPPHGTKLDRTGIATEADQDGIIWSRILYNGEVCYASTAFLAEEKPSIADVDKDFNILYENVYVVRKNGDIVVTTLNIRSLPSRSSNSIAIVGPDTMLLRIGIAKEPDNEGIIWSKVLYGDKVGYIGSGYLTKSMPTDTTIEPNTAE